MPQAQAPDKRSSVLVCHGPSCIQIHGGGLPGEAEALLASRAEVRSGPCLGMCPVGPNAIVRRGPIARTKAAQRIAKEDTILCGISDADELVDLVGQSLEAEEPPRLLKGRATPDNLQR